MSVQSIGTSTGILGQAETQFNQSQTSGNQALGENDFLNLLVTQLKNQDPLNPQDDQSFVAQLATFSSLEQLTNINSGITQLNQSFSQQQMFNATNFIGKTVTASGNTLAVSSGSASQLSYTLPGAAADVSLTFTDTTGNIMKTVDVGAQSAGQQTYQWDGTDANGNTVPNGNYLVNINAIGADGNAMNATTSVTGTVNGVSNSNGSYVLTTTDGRSFNLSNVQGVVTPPSSSSS